VSRNSALSVVVSGMTFSSTRNCRPFLGLLLNSATACVILALVTGSSRCLRLRYAMPSSIILSSLSLLMQSNSVVSAIGERCFSSSLLTSASS